MCKTMENHAGKLEQLFWAPKMHMFLRNKSAPRAQATRIRGHKRHRNRERLSGLVQQLTLRQISCILRWCEDSDLCPNLVDWTSGPVGLTLNEDIYSSNWLITNLLLNMFWYIWILLIFWWSFGVWEVWAGQVWVLHISFFNRGRLLWITAVRIISRESQAQTGGPIYPLTWYWAPYVWTWPGPQQTGKIHQNARHINHEHILQIFEGATCLVLLYHICLGLWLWESSENQQLTLRIYVDTFLSTSKIEALFLFNVFFPMYPADGAKLLVQHSNCVWCRKRRCIDACFVGLGHQPSCSSAAWTPRRVLDGRGKFGRNMRVGQFLATCFLNIFWSFCSLNF